MVCVEGCAARIVEDLVRWNARHVSPHLTFGSFIFVFHVLFSCTHLFRLEIMNAGEGRRPAPWGRGRSG